MEHVEESLEFRSEVKKVGNFYKELGCEGRRIQWGKIQMGKEESKEIVACYVLQNWKDRYKGNN